MFYDLFIRPRSFCLFSLLLIVIILIAQTSHAGLGDQVDETYFRVVGPLEHESPYLAASKNEIDIDDITNKHILPDGGIEQKPYTPDWPSLDSRPLPVWYDDAKFGIFVHWGVFSVPAYGSEWFWWYWKGEKRPEFENFVKKNYPPGFSYADFASHFTAELYDPVEWARIFKSSGAKYVVLTSKHHEGYTLWPSKYSWNWNALDVGPKRDLIGPLADAIRSTTDLKFGLYHSLFEWFHPLYLSDAKNNFTTQEFVKTKTMPELYEIVNKYNPSVIWSDGDAGPDHYWNSTNFIAWLYNESPVKDEIVVNDRWGSGVPCHHGGFYTCDDRYNPGKLLPHKWENCLTIDRNSWGFRRNARLSDFLSTHDLIKELASTVSCGGNMLLNVGPTSDGRITPIFEERLQQMGQWLAVNGEAIYGSRPWTYQNDTLTPNIWYTSSKDKKSVYAIVLSWPQRMVLDLGAPQVGSQTEITFLGYDLEEIEWVVSAPGIQVTFPPKSDVSTDFAWILRLDNLLN